MPEGVFAQVKFVATDDVADSIGDRITENHSFIANWSDHAAMLTLGANKILCRELFGKKAGPNAVPQWTMKDIKANTDVAVQEVQQANQQLHRQVMEEKIFDIVKERTKPEEAARRAREALEKRHGETKGKRMGKLSDIKTLTKNLEASLANIAVTPEKVEPDHGKWGKGQKLGGSGMSPCAGKGALVEKDE